MAVRLVAVFHTSLYRDNASLQACAFRCRCVLVGASVSLWTQDVSLDNLVCFLVWFHCLWLCMDGSVISVYMSQGEHVGM